MYGWFHNFGPRKWNTLANINKFISARTRSHMQTHIQTYTSTDYQTTTHTTTTPPHSPAPLDFKSGDHAIQALLLAGFDETGTELKSATT